MGAAIRTLTTAPREVWVALGLLYVFNVGLHWMGLRAGVAVDAAKLSFSAPLFAYQAVQAFGIAAAVGLMLHGLLGGEGVRRPDRGYLAFVAFTGMVSVLSGALALVVASVDPNDPAESSQRLGVALAAMMVGVFVLVRLLLLPIGWLTGQRMTVREAWARMQGQLLPYIWATFVLTVPPTLLAYSAIALQGDPAQSASRSPAWAILNEALLMPLIALKVGLDAAMYRRRMAVALS